jgi:FkbM family methyltransferase
MLRQCPDGLVPGKATWETAGKTMPTVRQRLLANVLHLYPFASGCATVANHRFLQALAGATDELVWARCPAGRVRCSLSDYVGRAVFYVGELDRKISWVVRRLVHRDDVALDIGANIGLVTLLLARQVGRQGRVYAFEPNPAVSGLLEQSIAENALENVVVEKCALGSEPGKLSLTVPRDNAGAGSLIRGHGRDSTTFMVRVDTLSAFADRHKLARLDFIKIDVEGFEGQVFRGGLEVLRRLRPKAILFELNQAATDPSYGEVLEVLCEAGYGFLAIPKCLLRVRLLRVDPSSGGFHSFHDFLAAPLGRPYEEVARAVRASGIQPRE